MLNKTKSIVVLIVCALLVATNAYGHEGHGVNAFGHDIEHMLWVVMALVVSAAVVFKLAVKNKK